MQVAVTLLLVVALALGQGQKAVDMDNLKGKVDKGLKDVVASLK